MYLEIGEKIRDNGKSFGLDCRGQQHYQLKMIVGFAYQIIA
jgi:hypothetical protein